MMWFAQIFGQLHTYSKTLAPKFPHKLLHKSMIKNECSTIDRDGKTWESVMGMQDKTPSHNLKIIGILKGREPIKTNSEGYN